MESETPRLTPREAAVELGVSLNQVYQLIWSEKLPAERLNSGWRISVEAIEARLKQREKAVTG